MLTERQLVAGLNLIPLPDQKRFFAMLGNGRFSKGKFAALIVSFAYAVNLVKVQANVRVRARASTLHANTGIVQIAGGKDQQEEELMAAAEILQSLAGNTKSTINTKSIIRQKVANALPYVTMAVGVLGLAANFYYTQIQAPKEAQAAYGQQTAECYDITNYLTSSTAGCLLNASSRRELAVAKTTQLAVLGSTVFSAVVLYGKKLRDAYISGGHISREDVLEHMPLTGMALEVTDVALDMFTAPKPRERITAGRGRPAAQRV